MGKMGVTKDESHASTHKYVDKNKNRGTNKVQRQIKQEQKTWKCCKIISIHSYARMPLGPFLLLLLLQLLFVIVLVRPQKVCHTFVFCDTYTFACIYIHISTYIHTCFLVCVPANSFVFSFSCLLPAKMKWNKHKIIKITNENRKK